MKKLSLAIVFVLVSGCSSSRPMPVPADDASIGGDASPLVCNECPVWCPECIIDPVDCSLSECAPFDAGR